MRTSAEQTKAAPTTLEAAVLALLASRGELSGYDLHKTAQRGVAYIWSPAKSHIYAVLPRLVADGLAARRAVAQAQRPDKLLYRITRRGRRTLLAWLEETPRSFDEFLLKVFFGDLLPHSVLVAHVERERRAAQERISDYRDIERQIAGNEDGFFGYLTLRYGLAADRARVRWADETLATLRRREDAS